MKFTAIDPGNHTGWATFVNGQLTACGVTEAPSALTCLGHTAVVIEMPAYRRGQPGDPNDLLTLARTVGRIEETARILGSDVTLVNPSTWKGSVPKKIHNQRILDALTGSEGSIVERVKCAPSVRHNMVDAIGIGLWYAGRDVNRVLQPTVKTEVSAIYCEHANEMPATCPCEQNCYCKFHSCKKRKST